MPKKWHQHLRTLFQHGLDLLFPPRCAGCQSTGHLLCPRCLRTMKPLSTPYCLRCGQPLEPLARICSLCQQGPVLLDGVRSVNLYQDALRHTIRAFKFRGQQRLAQPLGLLLALAFIRYGMRADALIPLPLHWKRQRQRGYNQAALLARVCAAALKVPCLENTVQRQRDTLTQVGLNARERRQNVSGAFALVPGAHKHLRTYHTIVLIDDVCTTGSSLEACAAPLYAAGVREVWGLVLARPTHVPHDASKGVL